MPPMALVTLVLANGPGFPQGSSDHRYEITVTLSPTGHLDPAAWLADPAPWPATRNWPGEPPHQGDVQWDEEAGWFLRLFPAAGGEAADAPVHASLCHVGQLRPGEYVTVREPGGTEYGYRVVSVS